MSTWAGSLQSPSKLMDEGYLLSQDVPRILEIAAQRWDYLMR